MATAHLVFGFLGSGKTTLARELEQRHHAVRFAPDERMARLFGEDPPAAIFRDKATAIVDLLEPVSTRCLSLGVDVVLDYGFWARTERDHARRLSQACGGRALPYNVVCPDDEARQRVAERTVEGLWITIGQLLQAFPPSQCCHYLPAAGYDAT